MSSLSLRKVNKLYGDVQAVKDFNLEIADKEFIVLVGPSGCGKSTTLRMIAGLEEISLGEIHIGDRLVNALPPKDRDIAMVFQSYALYPHMNVYENMAFGLRLRHFAKSDIERRVREAAQILEIETLLERKPKQLSGGQRQRVALGRAIVRQPSVFLFDEPLSNLDAKLRVQMRREISKLHQRLQATIIYVTHDQVEAMTLGDRIVIMSAGETKQIGSPLEVYQQPANTFVAGFIGSPNMNFFNGTVKSAENVLEIVTPDFSISIPQADGALSNAIDQELTFGIRPEDICEIDVATDTPTLRLKVDLLEPMGSEVIIYGHVGSTELVAKAPPGTTLRVDDEVALSLNVEKLHAFEAQSGERLV